MSLTISRTIEVSEKRKIGRNDPCYCGSGKKYKKCCLIKDEEYTRYTPEQKSGYVSKVSNWLEKQQFFEDILKRRINEIFGEKKELEEQEFTAVLETVIFEENIDGKIPFEYFLEKAQLSPADRSYYQSWKGKTKFSLFEILKIVYGKSLEVRDLMDGKTYFIFERLGTYGAEPGLILVGRIVPWQDHWMFTGGSLVSFPKETGYMVKRTVTRFGEKGFSQLEFVKAHFGKREKEQEKENIRELSHKKAKVKLSQELKKRNIKFDIESIERMILGKEEVDFEKINKLFASNCKTHGELDYLISLFMRVYQTHPKFEIKKEKPGPIEQMLVSQMMSEMPKEKIEKLPKEKLSAALKQYTNRWLDNPQKELSGKTPRQTIIEERIKLGNPHREISYKLSFTPVYSVGSVEEEVEKYNQAVRLMQKEKYIEALTLFSQLTGSLPHQPAAFRWYLNVGGCLMGLGEVDLAKKYIQKSLALNPAYDLSKKNIKRLNDKDRITPHILAGKQWLFYSIIAEGLVFNCSDITRNKLLQDTKTFLLYLKNQQVPISKVHRSIRLSDILKINSQFVKPDPEKFHYPYREEWQFPKVNFLHNVTLTERLTKDDGKHLVLTKKGEEFLSSSDFCEQFGIILRAWFDHLDWENLEPGGWRHRLLEGLASTLQEVSFTILTNLKKQAGRSFSFKEVVEGIFIKERDPRLNVVLPMFLNRIILSHLEWAGIIEIKSGTRLLGLPLVEKKSILRLTKFGICVISAIEKKMHEAIPKNIRELV